MTKQNEEVLSILDIENIDSQEQIINFKDIDRETSKNKIQVDWILSNETTILDLEFKNKK